MSPEMTALRWVLGLLAALTAVGAVASFVLYISLGLDLWLQRARVSRGWLYATLLFWFNLEIWRRVVLTLVHWRS